MRVLIVGASGGLASALADAFLHRGERVDLLTREARRAAAVKRHAALLASGRGRLFTVGDRYSEFDPQEAYQVCIFSQGLFSPRPLIEMEEPGVEGELRVGLTDPIVLTRKILTRSEPSPDERRDYCYIGSTSAYAGFRDTAVYCAVKHGLLGFVRAMNDEYAHTDVRFWLFSMGTMNTEMGARLADQDPTTFLDPCEVAGRIAGTVCSRGNLFEPEVLIRRRAVRFRKG